MSEVGTNRGAVIVLTPVKVGAALELTLTLAVTAEVDTHLFRLDQDTFYELMADRFEVARGIIRMLCRRVRTREYAG